MIDRFETPPPPPPPPPLEIRPCLAELFRTCVYPAFLPLRIERVIVGACNHDQKDESAENKPSYEDESKKAYRLFLSDGVLVVQALLQNRMVALISPDHIVVGNTVVLKKFKIKRARRLNGQGEVVFLGIADCDIVPTGQGMLLQAETKKRRSVSEDLGGRDSEEANMARRKRVKSNASSAQSSCRRRVGSNSSTADSDTNDFETRTFDQRTLDRRRKALHDELNTNRSLKSQKETIVKTATINAGPQSARSDTPHKYASTSATRTTHQQNPTAHRQPTSQLTQNPQPQSVPTSSNPNPNPTTHQPLLLSPLPPPSLPTTDPPYHTLSSLLITPKSPKPSSFAVTLFTIPSWLSPSLLPPRPHSPFPPKRHIKLHDPSISARHAGITLAVYCDAANFRPRLGVPVVVRGVVVHRVHSGEVVLNAYEKLMRTEGLGGKMGRWFEDDEAVLQGLGWDVKGLRGWWEGRERERERRAKGKRG